MKSYTRIMVTPGVLLILGLMLLSISLRMKD